MNKNLPKKKPLSTSHATISKTLAKNADIIVFSLAMSGVVIMFVWWMVLFNRLNLENEACTAHVQQTTPNAPAYSLHEKFHKRQLMIISEGSVLMVFILTSIVSLFIVAREKKRAKEQLESLVLISTHELKTPLSGLRALLQSFKMGSIPNEAKPQLIEHGLLACHRLEHLVESILTYQRHLIKGKEALYLKPIDIGPLLKGILDHRQYTLKEHQVNIQLAHATRSVLADVDAVRVIIENILDNADKYADTKQSPVSILDHTDDSYYYLKIRDQGIGLSEAQLKHLFDPFHSRTHAHTHQRIEHGSGLGLYIARRLAELCQGDLLVSSHGPQQGSTFTLKLRLYVPKAMT